MSFSSVALRAEGAVGPRAAHALSSFAPTLSFCNAPGVSRAARPVFGMPRGNQSKRHVFSVQGGNSRALISNGFSVPKRSVSSLPPRIDFQRELGSMDPLHVEYLGMKMADSILASLGPVGRASVDALVAKKKEMKGVRLSGPEAMMLNLAMMKAERAIEAGEPLLPGLPAEDSFRFVNTILWPIKEAITAAFSSPTQFLQNGLVLRLSDYEPSGVLREATEQLGIRVSISDVPTKYYLRLRLNPELTAQKAEPVFSMIEESQGVEFARTTFSIEDLIKEFKGGEK